MNRGPIEPATPIENVNQIETVSPIEAVSIVIPTHNGQTRLPACLISIAAQTFTGAFEVIVVADRCSDNAEQVATDLGARVLVNQNDPGPAGSRNTGIRVADFPLIVFTDDDCRPKADWLAELVEVFNATDAVAVGGAVIPSERRNLLSRYLEANNPMAPLEMNLAGQRSNMRRILDYLRKNLGYVNVNSQEVRPIYSAATANLAVRSSALERIGGFDESFEFSGEDQDLCRRLNLAYPARVLHAPKAVVLHQYNYHLADLLRRSFAYSRGNEVIRRKHQEIGMIIFPIPILWIFLTVIVAFALGWVWAPIPLALIPLAYAKYFRTALSSKRMDVLSYGFFQFAEEIAGNLGFLAGATRPARPILKRRSGVR